MKQIKIDGIGTQPRQRIMQVRFQVKWRHTIPIDTGMPPLAEDKHLIMQAACVQPLTKDAFTAAFTV